MNTQKIPTFGKQKRKQAFWLFFENKCDWKDFQPHGMMGSSTHDLGTNRPALPLHQLPSHLMWYMYYTSLLHTPRSWLHNNIIKPPKSGEQCEEITEFVVVEDHLSPQGEGDLPHHKQSDLHIQHIRRRWFYCYIL